MYKVDLFLKKKLFATSLQWKKNENKMLKGSYRSQFQYQSQMRKTTHTQDFKLIYAVYLRRVRAI